MNTQTISAEFPFRPNYVEINTHKLHYVDEGSGDPILFLHGNPTSSYLWRNILPYMIPHSRCIALDLIGMGKSDKPYIDYRFSTHADYVEGFIQKLNLKNLTLVVHDWGSALGFNYAMQNESNIKGLAFMEAIIRTATWNDFPDDFTMGFKLFRKPVIGWLLIVGLNLFVDQILPKAIIRTLSKAEHRHYKAPFKKRRHRKPVWQWPNEIPIDGQPADVARIVQSYNLRLQESDLPKLLFHATPGGIVTAEMVEWCRIHLKNLKTVDIGPGIHFIQEDNPHRIGRELAQWYLSL